MYSMLDRNYKMHDARRYVPSAVIRTLGSCRRKTQN